MYCGEYGVLTVGAEGDAEGILDSSADDGYEMDPRDFKRLAAMRRMSEQQDDKMDKRAGNLETNLGRRLEAKLARPSKINYWLCVSRPIGSSKRRARFEEDSDWPGLGSDARKRAMPPGPASTHLHVFFAAASGDGDLR